jgi:hypothetical protein
MPFSANSKRLVDKDPTTTLGAAESPDESLPAKIAVCLLDVDLSEPTYIILSRLHPKLSEGGVNPG